MRISWRHLAFAPIHLAVFASFALADAPEVTLKGGMQSHSMCVPNPQPEDKVWVVFAVDGSPEIAGRVKKVMDEFYPDTGLDADHALKLAKAYEADLKFFVDNTFDEYGRIDTLLRSDRVARDLAPDDDDEGNSD